MLALLTATQPSHPLTTSFNTFERSFSPSAPSKLDGSSAGRTAAQAPRGIWSPEPQSQSVTPGIWERQLNCGTLSGPLYSTTTATADGWQRLHGSLGIRRSCTNLKRRERRSNSEKTWILAARETALSAVRSWRPGAEGLTEVRWEGKAGGQTDGPLEGPRCRGDERGRGAAGKASSSLVTSSSGQRRDSQL